MTSGTILTTLTDRRFIKNIIAEFPLFTWSCFDFQLILEVWRLLKKNGTRDFFNFDTDTLRLCIWVFVAKCVFDFVFEVANDEQRRELDAAIDLISWGLEFETGCKAQSWKQIHKYTISAWGKTPIHRVGTKFTKLLFHIRKQIQSVCMSLR